DTTNTIDPCKNNICCADVTLNTVLVSSDTCSKHSSQYYNNSITGNIPVTESKIDNSETYYVSSTPTTNFSP
uniref:Uncharacterized protein n=1 Tax=Amphimedon queenslandica TaxID=400682 RepID=A0A1X7SPJ0_AMPQE